MEKTGDENMILYMIRHGESEANAGGYHSGWGCVHLTEKGRIQAEKTRALLKDIPIDELYVSDILRAQETAEIIFPEKDRTFITLAREINTTPFFGKNKEQLTEIYGQKYLDCRKNFDYAPLGVDCESLMHMSMRAEEMLKWAQKKENKSICVVSHAGFITAVAGRVLGIDAHSHALLCENASVCAFEFINGIWKLKLWNLAPGA